MQVFQTMLRNKDSSKLDTRLIIATTPERALAKAHKLWLKRYHSWTPVNEALIQDLGTAVPAGSARP